MLSHLYRIKETVDEYKKESKAELSENLFKSFTDEYDAIWQQGLAQIAEMPVRSLSELNNILQKTCKIVCPLKKERMLRFMHNFSVPFTNKQVERDLRMMKVRLKTSGCFRTFDGAVRCARIRTYMSTCSKRGICILEALENAVRGAPIPLYSESAILLSITVYSPHI